MNRNSVLYKSLRILYNFLMYEVEGILIEGGILKQDSIGKLKEYKNRYSGKSCFLIGSGPSLTMEDLNRLADSEYVTIACNSLFKAYEFSKWKADIYCISDEGVFDTVGEKVLDINKSKPFFVTENIYRKYKNNALIPIRVKTNYNYPKVRYFSRNLLKYSYPAGSVLYFMLQLAAYLGFNKVYLLGCDCNYSMTKMENGLIKKTSDKDYFMPGYEDRKGHQPINQYEIVIPDYIVAKEYYDINGIQVYNATRGGKLEVFKRVDFDTLF